MVDFIGDFFYFCIMEFDIYLNTAIAAAKEASTIHLSYFQKQMKISFKSTHYNMVTAADIEAEDSIVSIIRTKFPDHNILAEEKKYKQTDSPYTWIIDPLDGTNNFAHGIPIFSVSIALAKENKIVAGVVYDPTRDELFSAQMNNGAFLNGKSIKVTTAKTLSESILGTGFYYSRGKELDTTLKHIKDFFIGGIIGIRRFGSAALDLCNVACGRFDGFWEHYLNPWDFAAGLLIVQEAGGKVTNQQGATVPIVSSFLVSSNGIIHEDMLAIVSKE